MTKITYLDEEQGWQSITYAALADKYDMYIPETLPKDISDIWKEVCDSHVAIVDFRLTGDGVVAYTGDDVAREIHKHNKHFPVFIITSYEDNAIQECTETQIIRDKEMFTDPSLHEKLFHIINSAINIYNKKKNDAENCVRQCQEKISHGKVLTSAEESDKFDAELYLSELDMDTSARANLINAGTAKELEEMLDLARSINANYKNK